MSKVRVSLPSTRTHSCRHCLWEQVKPGLGILEVYEGKHPGTAKMTGRYLVREHEPTYCRRFEVLKQAADGGDTYWVSIGDDYTQDSCDCTGYESHAVCKHADSIRALIKENALSVRSTDPVSCFFTEEEYEDPT